VYDVFGRQRDLLWQSEHRWVVAVDDEDRATVMRPPADAFFDVVAELGPFDDRALRGLLARRVPEEHEHLIEQAVEHASGNPRRAIRLLAATLVDEPDRPQYLKDLWALETEASVLGRTHSMLFAELLNRGGGSASDEELQQSLGVTRARLAQLFGDLQAAGLVVASNERPRGPGRPRVVYRPGRSGS